MGDGCNALTILLASTIWSEIPCLEFKQANPSKALLHCKTISRFTASSPIQGINVIKNQWDEKFITMPGLFILLRFSAIRYPFSVSMHFMCPVSCVVCLVSCVLFKIFPLRFTLYAGFKVFPYAVCPVSCVLFKVFPLRSTLYALRCFSGFQCLSALVS